MIYIGFSVDLENNMFTCNSTFTKRICDVDTLRDLLEEDNVISFCDPRYFRELNTLFEKTKIRIYPRKKRELVFLGVGDSLILIKPRGLPTLLDYSDDFTDEEVKNASFSFYWYQMVS